MKMTLDKRIKELIDKLKESEDITDAMGIIEIWKGWCFIKEIEK